MVNSAAASNRKRTHSEPAPAIIVFNGCFCPVHAGHVKALEDTKRKLEADGRVRVVAGYFAVAPDGYVRKKVGDKLEPWMMASARVDVCKAVEQDAGWTVSAEECESWKRCGGAMVAKHHNASTLIFGVRDEAKKGGVSKKGDGVTADLNSSKVRAYFSKHGCKPEVVDDLVDRGTLGRAVGQRLKLEFAASSAACASSGVDEPTFNPSPAGISARDGKTSKRWRKAVAGSDPDHGLCEVDAGQQAGRDIDAGVGLVQLLRTGPAGEEAARAEASRQDRGLKGRRARIAQETLQILEAGGYHCNRGGGWVDLQDAVTAAVAASSFYAAGLWQLAGAPPAVSGRSAIEVRRCYVLDAAESLARCSGGAKLGVLNFASARNPGGGFTTGAEAQEESIARSSALYPCLMKHFDDFFTPNRNARSGAYTHALIYSPAVPVMRDSTGALLDSPYLVDFVTAAAPNRGTIIGNNAAKDAAQALQERAYRVLDIFARRGATDLVLGAWGCGVFRNDPRTVATVFADHLMGEFHGCFQSIVFAVPDEVNGSVFEEVFGDLAMPSKGVTVGSKHRIPGIPVPPAPTMAAQPTSTLSQPEKDYLKACRVVREIWKLEAREAEGEKFGRCQREKMQKKADVLREVRDLRGLLSSEFEGKSGDVLKAAMDAA